jgi:hypothetical protein
MASADEVARQRAQEQGDAALHAIERAAADERSLLAALQAEGRHLIRSALARQQELGHPTVVERKLSFRRVGLLGRRWVTVRKGCYPVAEINAWPWTGADLPDIGRTDQHPLIR